MYSRDVGVDDLNDGVVTVVALDVPRLSLRRSVILNDPVKILILDLESRVLILLEGNGMKSFGSVNGLGGSSNSG